MNEIPQDTVFTKFPEVAISSWSWFTLPKQLHYVKDLLHDALYFTLEQITS